MGNQESLWLPVLAERRQPHKREDVPPTHSGNGGLPPPAGDRTGNAQGVQMQAPARSTGSHGGKKAAESRRPAAEVMWAFQLEGNYPPRCSDIIIKGEFIGMGSQPDGINFPLPFVAQPSVDHILGEHLPFQQELVVLLKGIQGSV